MLSYLIHSDSLLGETKVRPSGSLPPEEIGPWAQRIAYWFGRDR